jgi:uncharacterized protein YerC
MQKNLGRPVQLVLADVHIRTCCRLIRILTTLMEINKVQRRISVAPMMDWTDGR